MTPLRILETQIHHATGIIYWLDGSSAETPAAMDRIPYLLDVHFTTRPADLGSRHAPGRIALWQRSAVSLIDGPASDSDKSRPAGAVVNLQGVISDPRGLYVPRRFDLTTSDDFGLPVVLYPSPQGTRFGRGGGLRGSLRFAAGGAVVPWALLTLTVSLPGGTQTYRGQADHRGDFALPTHRMPPLTEGTTDYAAQLSARALAAASPEVPVDPSALVAMDLEDTETPASFANTIGFRVVPGEIQSVRSAGKEHLAVQPS